MKMKMPRFSGETVWPLVAMVVVQLGYAGMNILSKVAIEAGMVVVQLGYAGMNILSKVAIEAGFFVTLPFALYLERGINKLTESTAAPLISEAPKVTLLKRQETSKNSSKGLTRPREPDFKTAQRARPVRVKSSAELEEEVMAKMPKFTAVPLNKKIFEAPTLPPIRRTTSCSPQFQEFHLETVVRASKSDMASAALTESNSQKILRSNKKKQVTIPQDERIPPPQPPKTMLSISSASTKPNPFQLHTEERGAEKERRFRSAKLHKELEEERARVPKANPYPLSTDFKVVPPKPEAKQCTIPKPFQLESLVRHEVEMQREMQERLRKDREEANMKIFKAQPILEENPIPFPQKERKPLTRVHEFNLRVMHRAIERSEFEEKLKEKDVAYKKYKEKREAAKMMEEKEALKQLRRTLVHHARPMPKFANPMNKE